MKLMKIGLDIQWQITVILTCSLLLLAGCGGAATPTSVTSNTGDPTATRSGTGAATATAEPPAAATPTTAPALPPTETPQPIVPPTDTPQPPAASGNGKIGERQESGGIALTVNKVSTTEKINDFLTPKEGNMYLVVDVVVENATRDTTPYNPLYFKVKDAGGFEYSASLLAPDPSLKSGDLAKGEKARGNVSFEVPKTADGFVLNYEPLVILGGYEPIRVDLSAGGGTAESGGASAAPTEAPAASPAGGSQIGQRVESGGIAVTANKVSTAEKINDFLTPKEGNVYLVVDVVVENATRDTAPYNPLYFKLKDAEGFEYSASLLAPDPSLKSGDLAKGEKARGNISFEVPQTAKGFVLNYEPLVIMGGYEPIRINLGQ